MASRCHPWNASRPKRSASTRSRSSDEEGGTACKAAGDDTIARRRRVARRVPIVSSMVSGSLRGGSVGADGGRHLWLMFVFVGDLRYCSPEMAKHAYLTAPLKTDKMPPGVAYIVGNEAAERFSYYGMNSILV